jgi:uncharacterized membrane protein YphA (DoxX/SURF4 family)
MRTNYLIISLRVLVALTFIFSAISKLFPIEVFELNFVYQGISNWDVAPYLARFLIILELFLGVSLLFTNLLKQLILPATLFLLVSFSFYLLFSIYKNGNEGNCGCFGTLLPMSPLQSLSKNFFLILITLFIYSKTESKPWKFKWLLPSLFILISTSIALLYPIYDYTYQTNIKPSVTADISDITGFSDTKIVNLKEGKKLVAVFNMACSHCVEVALKLAATKSRIHLPDTYFILLGDSTEVTSFYSLTNSVAPYKLMPSSEFIKRYKSGWPRVCLLDEGIIKYDNDYHSFNGKDFEREVINFISN